MPIFIRGTLCNFMLADEPGGIVELMFLWLILRVHAMAGESLSSWG
jgi:hypothetical protein